MSLADSLKKTLDVVRGIPGLLGLREYSVSVLVREWSTRPGVGTKTETITPILVNGQNPSVRRLSSSDILASGGLYQDMDLEVTFTPEFYLDGYGGVSQEVFSIEPKKSEVFFIVSGPGLDNASFKKISQSIIDVLTYKIVIRKDGRVL